LRFISLYNFYSKYFANDATDTSGMACIASSKTLAEIIEVKKKISKATTVTGHGGLYGCERSRLPYSLGNRLQMAVGL
jgi:hypothetical protein